MEKSAACDYPVHAEIRDDDRSHHKFSRYMEYRNAMTLQLVTCQSFTSWLVRDDETERGHENVYQVTSDKAQLAMGWYKNKFAPRTERMTTYGPFTTQAEAESA